MFASVEFSRMYWKWERVRAAAVPELDAESAPASEPVSALPELAAEAGAAAEAEAAAGSAETARL